MPASLFDSALYARLLPTADAGRLFSDSAEVRAMMLVEGALAKVQGDLGVIPADAAAFLHRASLELQLDPAGMAEATGQNGVSVPGLVAAMRKALEAPAHAQYLHWGATSQDIMDTGLMLRLKQVLAQQAQALDALLAAMAVLADAQADTPMAARTYGQAATPTSFGAVVAEWGGPLLELRPELARLTPDALWVQLAGAAGTAAALGPSAPEQRRQLAAALGLHDPGRAWHADRTPILRIGGVMARLAVALGKIGEDLILLTQTGVAELTLGQAGGSSTMPQKQNPVVPSMLVALARHAIGLHATVQGAGLHRQQRDGAAWFTEWLVLPQLCLAAHSTLIQTCVLIPGITPRADRMRAVLTGDQNLIHAEALSFRLAEHLPRPEAQAAIKALAQDAIRSGADLAELARAAYPTLPLDDVFAPEAQMGHAPADARAFAVRVRAVLAAP
jgi:3-carboxy-cis,cis-muconate cycloisomerase